MTSDPLGYIHLPAVWKLFFFFMYQRDRVDSLFEFLPLQRNFYSVSWPLKTFQKVWYLNSCPVYITGPTDRELINSHMAFVVFVHDSTVLGVDFGVGHVWDKTKWSTYQRDRLICFESWFWGTACPGWWASNVFSNVFSISVPILGFWDFGLMATPNN